MSSDKGMKKKKGRTRNLLRALKHEIRRILLRGFIESKEPLSPARFVERTNYPIATVTYHIGVLRDCGTVTLADERQVRGATELLYESTVDDDPAARAILDETEEEDEASRRRAGAKGKLPRRRRRPL